MPRFVVVTPVPGQQVFLLRRGMTVSGLVIGAGRGVYTALCALGGFALLTGRVPGYGPTAGWLGALGLGLTGGCVYGLLPHRRMRQWEWTSVRRIGRSAALGLVSFPCYLCLAASMAANTLATQSTVPLTALVGGAAGVVAYAVRQLRTRRGRVVVNGSRPATAPPHWTPALEESRRLAPRRRAG
jgi:hypothetical protein